MLRADCGHPGLEILQVASVISTLLCGQGQKKCNVLKKYFISSTHRGYAARRQEFTRPDGHCRKALRVLSTTFRSLKLPWSFQLVLHDVTDHLERQPRYQANQWNKTWACYVHPSLKTYIILLHITFTYLLINLYYDALLHIISHYLLLNPWHTVNVIVWQHC